jgi:hypothetical protein
MKWEDIDFSSVFEYDESVPSCIRWKVDRKTGKGYKIFIAKKGDVAGTFHSTGYYHVNYDGKSYKVHRVIFEMLSGTKLGSHQYIDHLNGVRSDNRFKNLRVVSNKCNTRNRSIAKSNTSSVNGVHLRDFGNRVYFVASWNSEDSKVRNRYFNIGKLGVMVAFRDAVITRRCSIELLNKQGAGYSDRHGLETSEEVV